MARKTDQTTVRLRPADSFDLIRLIARSQSDPRKAVAELVQNSLDAGASDIRITWFTHQGLRAISILDDGGGVFPAVDRPDALRKVATTIGHSHKARLTPAERHRQMTLGKYGIGLLGFWSVGMHMEVRSRVAGSDVWMLAMEEDVRDARVRKRRPGKLPLDATFTEIVVTHIHPVAAQQVMPRRLAAYLAGELRGQLLSREVHLEIYDRVARGRTQKRRVVKPRRYRGIHLADVREFAVAGFAPARLDLYLIPEGEDRRGVTALACGGATVLDDMATVDGGEEPRGPWASGRIEGVVDFPDLSVAPSRRRGFVPDEAARAFLDALPELEARLRKLLEEDAERTRRDQESDDANRIRKLFRRLPRLLPDYAFFEVSRPDAPGGDGAAVAAGASVPDVGAEAEWVRVEEGTAVGEPETPETPETEFFYPPGPLHSVDVRPKKSVLSPGGERMLRAVPHDRDGRAITDGVSFAWRLEGPGRLSPEGERAIYRAPDEPGEARGIVTATQGDVIAEGDGRIRVTEAVEPPGGRDAGIPDPEPNPAPAEPWRSRILEGRWQYNSAHPDYLSVRDDRRRRIAYLARLFAKEVVLRNFGDPGDSRVLERMVQVLTYVESPARGR